MNIDAVRRFALSLPEVTEEPHFHYEKLFWGKKVASLRVTLAAARPRDVEQLLKSAWLRKAPKKLASAHGND